jgi:hypothetical protein
MHHPRLSKAMTITMAMTGRLIVRIHNLLDNEQDNACDYDIVTSDQTNGIAIS